MQNDPQKEKITVPYILLITFLICIAILGARFVTVYATEGLRKMFFPKSSASSVHSEPQYHKITVLNLKTGKEEILEARFPSPARFSNGLHLILSGEKAGFHTFEGYKITVPSGVIDKNWFCFTDNVYNIRLTEKDTGKTENYIMAKLSDHPLYNIPCVIILKEDGTAVIYGKSDVVLETEIIEQTASEE